MLLEQITDRPHVFTRRRFLAATALAATSVFLAGCSGREAEPVAAHVTVQSAPLEVRVGKPLEFENFGLRWQHEASEGIDYLTYHDGNIYYSKRNVVHILDGDSGAHREIVTDAYPKLTINPHIVGDRLFFVENALHGCADLYIYILKTGKKIFKTPKEVGLFPNTLALSKGGVIYAAGYDEEEKVALFAFSPDGKELFRRDLKDLVPAGAESMHIYKDYLLILNGWGFYAIDPITKSLKWKYIRGGEKLPEDDGSIMHPTKEGNSVYFITQKILSDSIIRVGHTKTREQLRAFDIDTQKERWVFNDKENVSRYSMHKYVGDSRVYLEVHMSSGKVNILDGATGKATVLPTGKFPLESAAFFDNVAYVVDKGRVLALNPKDGTEMQRYSAAEPITGTVIGVNSNRIFVRDDKKISAYGNK